MPTPPRTLPPLIEEYRDQHWFRDPTLRVETAAEAETFVERAGFAASLTDSRFPAPSLYVAVCGRRDVRAPQNVQKDPEMSAAWLLKDELLRRGRVYYGKLARGKSMFVAPRMIPYFFAVYGIRRAQEAKRLSEGARMILQVLRKEWEMASADLRKDAGLTDRKAFDKAMEELQSAMIVIPSEVLYEPKFTYIWTLAEARFPDAIKQKIARADAVREIARCFLTGAGMTIPAELAKVTGLARPEAGLGNRALVTEGFAVSPAQGTYILTELAARLD
ncbi:MAG: hypothetical protein ACKV2V_28740 [Blastocatellia bacterium]